MFSDGEVKDGCLHIPPASDSEIKLTFSIEPKMTYPNPPTGKDEVCLTRGPLVY